MQTTGLQQQLVRLIDVNVTVVVGTVSLVVEVVEKSDVLVTVNMSLSVIVSDISAVSVTVSSSVRVRLIVLVVKGPVGTVEVVMMGDPSLQRTHRLISHTL